MAVSPSLGSSHTHRIQQVSLGYLFLPRAAAAQTQRQEEQGRRNWLRRGKMYTHALRIPKQGGHVAIGGPSTTAFAPAASPVNDFWTFVTGMPLYLSGPQTTSAKSSPRQGDARHGTARQGKVRSGMDVIPGTSTIDDKGWDGKQMLAGLSCRGSWRSSAAPEALLHLPKAKRHGPNHPKDGKRKTQIQFEIGLQTDPAGEMGVSPTADTDVVCCLGRHAADHRAIDGGSHPLTSPTERCNVSFSITTSRCGRGSGNPASLVCVAVSVDV